MVLWKKQGITGGKICLVRWLQGDVLQLRHGIYPKIQNDFRRNWRAGVLQGRWKSRADEAYRIGIIRNRGRKTSQKGTGRD